MTRHRELLLQPEDYRDDPYVPMWAHFPRLHLLFGWGPGIWEAVGDGIAGLRHVFLPAAEGKAPPPIASVIDWRDRYYMFSKLRELAPSLEIEGVGAHCVRYRLDDIGIQAVNAPCAHGRPHVIVPDGEYRVRHECGDAGVVLTLERRTKSLKAEHRATLESLGLAYGPGTGKRDERPDGLRSPAEQAFAAHAAKTKAAYVERRVKELLKDPGKRPADFAERAAARMRSRMGEMERRKCDSGGRPKRPYPEDELTRRTCVEIARIEATDMMFDLGREDVCALSADGFRSFIP
ncbi:MAG TPA: hypothetical protein VLC10_01215 [Patescibacteria group bacterium]|nr:hypothetical protein [Patescibacteria group bacterium]